MKKSFLNRNIFLYGVYSIFSEPLFWGPILMYSLQEKAHMDLSEIYFMESVAMILCILLNIPSGALADRIGRRKVLILARIFLIIYVICFAFTATPLDAWIANFLWAIGSSLQSGADQAMFFNTLKANGLKNNFFRLEGKYVGIRFLIISVCSIATGYLAKINIMIPLVLSIPFTILPLISVIFYKEEENESDGKGILKQVETMKNGISFVSKKKEILWIVFFVALLAGASKIWFFTYSAYFMHVGIDLKNFGYIFAFLNLIAFAASKYAYKLRELVSEEKFVLYMILFIGLPILLMGLFPMWQMVFLLGFQNIVRGAMSPFVGTFMNMHIEDEKVRSTTLSVRSTFTDSITIFSLSWFGFMDKRIGMINALIILGVLVLILGHFSFRGYKRLFKVPSIV